MIRIHAGTHDYIKIKSIKRAGTGKVIDLTCKSKPHTFIANNILVHNCSVTAAKKLLFPKALRDYLRTYSPERAVGMIEDVCRRFKIKKLNFDDELLPAYKPWMEKFCKLYKERIYNVYTLPYIMNSRANVTTEDMVKIMAESGCEELRIGFETGNYSLRKDILDKDITDEQMISAYTFCRQYGIKASAFMMMGVPGETRETFKDTVNLVVKCKPYIIRLTFLFPFEHTPIYDYCVKNDLFKYPPGHHYKHFNYFTESPLKFKDLSDKDITRFKILFPWFINDWGLNHIQYKRLLMRWWDANYGNEETMKAIYEEDTAQSENMTEGHYRFFDSNRYIKYEEPKEIQV